MVESDADGSDVDSDIARWSELLQHSSTVTANYTKEECLLFQALVSPTFSLTIGTSTASRKTAAKGGAR